MNDAFFQHTNEVLQRYYYGYEIKDPTKRKETDEELRKRVRYVAGKAPTETGAALDRIAANLGLARRTINISYMASVV